MSEDFDPGQRKDLFDQFDLDLNKMLGFRRRKSGIHTE